MERAVRLLKDKKISREMLSEEDIARSLWPQAVGKTVAAHSLRIKLVRTTLIVEVEDAIWQKQLFGLSRQILGRLHKLLGSNDIQDIEFRIGLPRRQPQRSDAREPNVSDEAEAISDPVLKKVYQGSRRKATG